MAKSWYVVHTYTGFENRVEKAIRLLMGQDIFKPFIYDIKIPQEEVVELKDGKKRVSKKKFFPGYILIELDLPDNGWKPVCSAIRTIQGVTGFVGTKGITKPQPISSEEAKAILQRAGEIKSEKTLRSRQTFTMGENVRIVNGPFESFTGSIEEINTERGKLKVVVGIFGRSTPVELEFAQVEKI